VIRERITSGGAIIASELLAEHVIDEATWRLWRDTCGGSLVRTWIELTMQSAGRRLVFTEGAGLTRADCPLEWLARSVVVDRDWRDRVWQWHEARVGGEGEE